MYGTHMQHMHAAILNVEATKGKETRMRCSRRELAILSRIRYAWQLVPPRR